MTKTLSPMTSDQIRDAVKTLKKLRPAYTSLLDFYEQIFIAQEGSKSRINIHPIKISDEILSIKAKEKLPLISISEFVIDGQSAGELLRTICDIANGANKIMADSTRALINALDKQRVDSDLLFTSLIEENDAFFEKIEQEQGVDKNILAFVAYHSIRPSLVLCAEQLATYLDSNDPWERGYCPICGSPPGLSMLEGEGERFLFCSFCWHKWSARRVCCPFCENTEAKTLHYFFNEEEKDYRVNVCDGCKKYIKTVDTRKTDRMVYPPIEMISTLHLDMQAKEKGLKSGAPLSFQT